MELPLHQAGYSEIREKFIFIYEAADFYLRENIFL